MTNYSLFAAKRQKKSNESSFFIQTLSYWIVTTYLHLQGMHEELQQLVSDKITTHCRKLSTTITTERTHEHKM